MNARRLLEHGDPASLTERQFTSLLVDVARIAGWRRYHTFDSRRSNHGFPDWVLVKGSRLLFVELKSEIRKVRPDQAEWLDALRQVPVVEVHLWRPSDWPTIVETLTGKTPR